MQKLFFYQPEHLAPVVAEGKAGFANEISWVVTFAQGAAKLVKRNPRAYLSFGPYWWPLKAIMQRESFIGGEPVDTDLLAQVALPTDALNCAAAFVFHERETPGTHHTMWQVSDGGSVDFVLVDEDIEAGIL